MHTDVHTSLSNPFIKYFQKKGEKILPTYYKPFCSQLLIISCFDCE